MSTTPPVTSMSGGFRKSSYSNDGPSCVEPNIAADPVLIRDSKQNGVYVNDPGQQPMIALSVAQWPDLLDLVLSARSGAVGSLVVDLHDDGSADLIGIAINGESVRLSFTTSEWDAFQKGVADGEFDPH